MNLLVPKRASALALTIWVSWWAGRECWGLLGNALGISTHGEGRQEAGLARGKGWVVLRLGGISVHPGGSSADGMALQGFPKLIWGGLPLCLWIDQWMLVESGCELSFWKWAKTWGRHLPLARAVLSGGRWPGLSAARAITPIFLKGDLDAYQPSHWWCSVTSMPVNTSSPYFLPPSLPHAPLSPDIISFCP